MITPADFDALLAAFRAAGLRIGVSETLRAGFLLSRLAAANPGPGPLRHALRALVVKSEQEPAIFDRVFDEWAGVLRSREQSAEAAASPKPNLHQDLGVSVGPARRAKGPRPRRWAMASALVLLGLVGVVAHFSVCQFVNKLTNGCYKNDKRWASSARALAWRIEMKVDPETSASYSARSSKLRVPSVFLSARSSKWA